MDAVRSDLISDVLYMVNPAIDAQTPWPRPFRVRTRRLTYTPSDELRGDYS